MAIAPQFDVIGLGELLWDCFPDGRKPGGAPANVAFHAQQLGLSARVATRVGNDSLGDELCGFLSHQGLHTDLVQRDSHHGTGTVTVDPQSDGSTRYAFLENSAWDFLEPDDRWLAAMSEARAVCFGTLAQRGETSRATIQRCLQATAAECLRVYDVNLRPPFFDKEWIVASLKLARIVKLNDDEVRTLASMLGSPYLAETSLATWLRQTFRLDVVCITRGSRGAVAVSADEICDVPGLAVTVADTVGAGDAFTAGLIWSRLHGHPLIAGLALANRIGALVASRPGAMPDLRTEFAALLRG
ncbi:MAG TPA: carbohydrate kinase [Planctomycetaceae bacterium]|nr:carbohydrate kinase [Planctomycetaceae bacterium]